MSEGNNLFNTFSFNVWKSNNAEGQLEEANKKRRKKQIRKLKEALKKDKLGSQKGGGGMTAEELAALLAILAAEDSGGDNGWRSLVFETFISTADTESDVDDDTLAEVKKNAFLTQMMQNAGVAEDDGLFKYNRKALGWLTSSVKVLKS